MRRAMLMAAAAAAAAAAGPAAAQTFDAAADFSTSSGNPNGAWAYGYSSTLSGAVLTTMTPNSDPVRSSWLGPAGGVFPVIERYNGTAPVDYGSVNFLPGELHIHPGPGGEYGVVRFTAPAAGSYSLAAGVTGADTGGTTTDAHLFTTVAGLTAAVWDQTVTGYRGGSGGSFDLPALALGAGDTVELWVGFGGNGYSNDSTAVQLVLVPVPEPAALALAAVGLAAVRRWPRGS